MILAKYNFPKFVVFLLISLSLSSCGGGGGGSSSTTAAPTISSISRNGVSAPFTGSLSITGTNFGIGMTLSITSSQGTQPITPTTVTSTQISVTSVSINSAPTERYVTVNILSGVSTVASTTMGVASASKTLAADIQPIFNTYCTGCHGSNGNLSLSIGNSASNLIQTTSSGCSGRLRVKAGDPRITSSFLIDKLTSNSPCGGGIKMTGSPTAITQTEIDAIINWVAGGAF